MENATKVESCSCTVKDVLWYLYCTRLRRLSAVRQTENFDKNENVTCIQSFYNLPMTYLCLTIVFTLSMICLELSYNIPTTCLKLS